MAEGMGLGLPLVGSASEVAESINAFAGMGVTMLELVPVPWDESTMGYMDGLIAALDR
jgi:hypothetical protein